MDLKKGDEVIFDISHTEPVLIDADQLFICNMVDVIAVVSAKHLSVIPGAKQA
jgi:co-chaperonin GroES (HSP10)